MDWNDEKKKKDEEMKPTRMQLSEKTSNLRKTIWQDNSVPKKVLKMARIFESDAKQNSASQDLRKMSPVYRIALWDSKSEFANELNFSKNEKIKVISTNSNGWWVGEVNGITGNFPVNYTSACPSSSSSLPSPRPSSGGSNIQMNAQGTPNLPTRAGNRDKTPPNNPPQPITERHPSPQPKTSRSDPTPEKARASTQPMLKAVMASDFCSDKSEFISRNTVVKLLRELGDGWLVSPAPGAPPVEVPKKFLKILGPPQSGRGGPAPTRGISRGST